MIWQLEKDIKQTGSMLDDGMKEKLDRAFGSLHLLRLKSEERNHTVVLSETMKLIGLLARFAKEYERWVKDGIRPD
tara:strand:+ start:513 stop:740 length:228 start_codon:yes stop_codon:yes gene_type:complete